MERSIFCLSLRQRAEARSRAPEYASYYERVYGSEAVERLRRRASAQRRGSYYRFLYRLAIKELNRRGLR